MCFKMKMPNVQMPTVQTTARDLLPSTAAKEPDSASFGDGSDTTDITKKKGVAALQIKPKTDTSKGYNPTNSYF